jgi:ElaB/YqjD/DUF883 family membrane-anchored ribosome-binding protein
MDRDREIPGTGRTEGMPGSEAAGLDRERRDDLGTGAPSLGDAGTRAGAYDRKFAGEDTGRTGESGDQLEHARERVEEALESGRERAGEIAESGRNRVAGQLESLGHRIEDRAREMEQAGGVKARAGHVARRAGEALDDSADYLRTHDTEEMRDDLERAIRDRPLLSVGIAAGAGFLLARILRD